MHINEQKEIFSSNLKKIVANVKLPQNKIAKEIGVSPQTFNTWMQGIAIPRMEKIQKIADYFNIEKSDLIDNKEQLTTISSTEKKLQQTIKKLQEEKQNILLKYAKKLLEEQENKK